MARKHGVLYERVLGQRRTRNLPASAGLEGRGDRADGLCTTRAEGADLCHAGRVDNVPSSAPGHVPGESEAARQAELYAKAAEIAKDSLDDQLAELDAMRGRAVQFLAFVGSATAFLVGTAISGAEMRGGWFAAIGGAASVGFVALLVLLRSLLTGSARWWGGPAMDWNLRQDATTLTEWLDERGSRISQAAFYRYLVESYREQTVDNDGYLRALRRRYIAFLYLGSGGLLVWGALAWFYGAGTSGS